MKRVIRALGTVALLLLGLTSLARALLYLAYVYFQARTPLEAFHLEPKMVYLAWRAQQGLAMYPDWHDLPNYESNFFGPLYFLVVGWMGKSTGAGLRQLYLLGRAVTVASGFVGAGIVGIAAGRRYGKGAGLVASWQSLGAAPLAGFGVVSRPDLMADTLGLGAFLLAIGPPGKKMWRLMAAGVLMVLAVMTKQTAGVYLLAAGLGLAAGGRKRAPTVAVLRYSRSSSDSLQITCIIPIASAASVPGRICTCQSDLVAVGLRYGSIVTIVAPRFRASIIRLHRWLFVFAVFDPQLMISRHFGTPIGSAPSRPAPFVTSYPAIPAVAQIVRSSFDAPSAWKNRLSRLSACSFPIVP